MWGLLIFTGGLRAQALDPLDDWWLARTLERLEGWGVIPLEVNGPAVLTRQEVAGLVPSLYGEVGGRSDLVGSLREQVRRDLHQYRVAPSDRFLLAPTFALRLAPATEDLSEENLEGRTSFEGFNLAFGAGGTVGWDDWLTVSVRSELRFNRDGIFDRSRLDFLEANVRARLGALEIGAGLFPYWWGAGRHGTLILSTNADPLPALRVATTRSFRLPWILGYLGPTDLEYFLSKLEGDRRAPHPVFSGFRVTFSPFKNLQFGISETATFGGEGMRVSVVNVLGLLVGIHPDEVAEESNQLVGFDFRLRVPIPGQPVVLYGEVGAEDNLTVRNAYLWGFYLPSVGPLDRLALRVEYAQNWNRGQQLFFWYNHDAHRPGYRFHDRILGHRMGSDAQAISAELGILAFSGLHLAGGVSFERAGIGLPVHQQKNEYRFRSTYLPRGPVQLHFRYEFESINNRFVEPDGTVRGSDGFLKVAGDRDAHLFELSVVYRP